MRRTMTGGDGTHTLPPRGLREVAGPGQRLPDRRGRRAALRADAGPDPGDLRRPHRRVRRRDPAALGARRARVRRPAADLQPRRLRGRAVGQRRPRGGALPAPPRLGDRRQFSIQTAAGEIRPTITSADDRPARHRPRADCRAPTIPPAARDGVGAADRRRPRTGAFSTSRSATRSARSASPTRRALRALDLPAIGPAIEHHELFPQPHERLLVRAAGRRPDPRADLRARGGGDRGERDRRDRGGGRPRARRRRLAR